MDTFGPEEELGACGHKVKKIREGNKILHVICRKCDQQFTAEKRGFMTRKRSAFIHNRPLQSSFVVHEGRAQPENFIRTDTQNAHCSQSPTRDVTSSPSLFSENENVPDSEEKDF